MKSIFFFLLPIVTLILFYQTTIVIPDSEIVVSDVYGSNYHDIGYKDGHHLWTGYLDQHYVKNLAKGNWELKDVNEWLMPNVYAPTYGYTNAGYFAQLVGPSEAAGSTCTATGHTKSTASAVVQIGLNTAGATCNLLTFEWDISSISVYSTIDDTDIQVDVSIATEPRNMDFNQMTYQPSLTGADTLWDDNIGSISNTSYVTDSTCCNSVANDIQIDLGTTADDFIESTSLGQGWFAVGYKTTTITRGSVLHNQAFGGSSFVTHHQLQIVYTSGAPPTVPSQVTGLTATPVGTDEIDLSWTAPSNGGSAITGYHIKAECPTGSGFQDLVTDTQTTSTTLRHVGLEPGTECNYKVAAINAIGTGAYSDPASATSNTSACTNVPYAVTDLATYTIENNRIGLTWSEPNLLGCSISGYQINYTTPYSSNPVTIIQPNTGSSQVNYLVNLLTKNTQYSFRIATITAGGHNATGNVVNATTTNLGVPDFFPGGLNFTQTNTNDIKIIFERQDINATDIFLNVTYPDTYNMTCNLAYKYAMSNQNYSNLDYVTQGDDRESSFQFHDFTNEVITAKCIDENSDDFGKYVIAQTNFEYLQLVHGFQSGEFGTMGQFGAIDLVTLIVVISAMVGLNSVNETVGGIFLIAILGALWYFNIVSLYTVMLSGVVLVILLIITTTRKD